MHIGYVLPRYPEAARGAVTCETHFKPLAIDVTEFMFNFVDDTSAHFELIKCCNIDTFACIITRVQEFFMSKAGSWIARRTPTQATSVSEFECACRNISLNSRASP